MRWREAESVPSAEEDDTTARRSSSLDADHDEADCSSPDGGTNHVGSPEADKRPRHHKRLEASPDREDYDDGGGVGSTGGEGGGSSDAGDNAVSSDKQRKEIKEESDPPDRQQLVLDDEGTDHAEEPPGIPWKPQTVQSTCEFTHTITNYSQQRESGCKKAEYSDTTVDEFGNRWRLIIYVNGNGRASNHHLSLFLQVADADDLPFGWKKAVSYVLTLEHPKGGTLSYAKRNPDKTFKLCPKAIDWGWSQFITSDRIQQEGFVSDDSLTVRASVTVKSSSICIDEEDAELYLKCAVEEGDADAVRLCLEQGALVNCKFKDDLYTPLHTACSSGTSKGSIDVLNLLLEMGADPNACNKWRETPLLIAANNGHYAACESLLEHGADPSLCSEAGWSALTFAAHKGYDDIVRLLLEKGAPVNTRVAEDNSTPLHKACAGSKPGHLCSVKLLIESQADVHALNKWRETPLLTAANHGQAASVKLLLDAGADPCKCTDTGWSPLSIAAYKGHDDVVRLLLEEGAPTEEEDPTLSALLQAATKGLPGTVDLLLKNGADHTVTTKKGDTALSILVEQNLIDAAVDMVTQYSASIPRCSRDRKKVQRARLLINLRMKQMEREGKHLAGSTDEDESDDEGSTGSQELNQTDAQGGDASKAKAKKKKEEVQEVTNSEALEEKARAAEEALLLQLELEDERAKKEEAEANSKRQKKKKKKEQLRHQKLKEEEDRRRQEELKAKEREQLAKEKEAKKRKEMEEREQEKREQEIKEMMEREKAMAVKRKERERREKMQSRQREKDSASTSPSGSEDSDKRLPPNKLSTAGNGHSVGSKQPTDADPAGSKKKSTPTGRKVAPLGGNRRWETKPKSSATPQPAAQQQPPPIPRSVPSTRSDDKATPSVSLAPRSKDPALHGMITSEQFGPAAKYTATSSLPMTSYLNGTNHGGELVFEHPAVSLFRREKVHELMRQCSTSVGVRPISIKRAIYRWTVIAAHESHPYVDALIPSWTDLNRLVAHFRLQFLAEGRRGSLGHAGVNTIEVVNEAATSVALMCQGLANEVAQFRVRIQEHVPVNWTDAAIEMTYLESMGVDGVSVVSISWANQFTVQILSDTLAVLRKRYIGPPGRLLSCVFAAKIWYECLGLVVADTGLGLRIPSETIACLAREASVSAETWSDPFSAHGQNAFWGHCEDMDRPFGGLAPFGKVDLRSDDVLSRQGGAVAVLPPLDSVAATSCIRRIVDILAAADRTGTPVSFAIFLPFECFSEASQFDLNHLDPRLSGAPKNYIRHFEILPAGQHVLHSENIASTQMYQSLFVLMQNEPGKRRYGVSVSGLRQIVASLSVRSPELYSNHVVTPLTFAPAREPPLTPQHNMYLDGLPPISPDLQSSTHSEFSTFAPAAMGKNFGTSFDTHNRLSRHGRLFDLVDDGEDDPLNDVDLVSGMLNTLDVGLFHNGSVVPEVDIEAISLMGIGMPPSHSSRPSNTPTGRYG